MKKVITGAAILIASLSLLAGCGESATDKKHDQSVASSKKAARISSREAASESKAVKKDVAEATVETKRLFANSDALDYEEPDYSRLYDGTTSEDVEEVEKQVDMLPNSKTRTKLQKLVSKAMAMAKGQEPKVNSSESKADESSLAKYRSESIDKELSSTSSSVEKSSKTSNNADKYAKKIMDLGVPTHATNVSYSNHTVTWTGFDAWKDYSHDELDELVAFLETITLRQATVYNQGTPKMIVKLSDGTQICHKNSGQDIVWDN